MITAASGENPLAQDLESILEQTRDLWDGLRGKNIFVTGGTGFFGRWLVESFVFVKHKLQLDARMVVLSRDPEAFQKQAPALFRSGALQIVKGDVRSFTRSKVASQLRDFPEQFDFVIHAATEASAKLNAEDPLRMVDTIVQGTRSTLDFAVACGAKRFLLTSSGAVYGPQPSRVTHVPEGAPTGPDCTLPESAYGEGKRLAELLSACYYQQHGLEPLIARCFAFVGPFLPLDTHFAIGNFIRDALRGGPIRVNGDGTALRSYLYAADLAVWLYTILFKGQPCRAYNVGSSEALSIAEIAQAVRHAVDPELTVTVAKVALPGAAAARYVPCTERAERELCLRASIPLEEAIRRTCRG